MSIALLALSNLLVIHADPTGPLRAPYCLEHAGKLSLLDAAGKPKLVLDVGETKALALDSNGSRAGFLRGQDLWSVFFVPEAKPVLVAKLVLEWRWAPTGSRLAFRTSRGLHTWNAGIPAEPPVFLGSSQAFDWSSDGNRLISFDPSATGGKIEIYSLDGGKTRTILEGHAATRVAWAPNGRRFAFLKPVLGKPGFANLIVGTLGSSSLKNVLKEVKGELRWSPDSRRILVSGSGSGWVVDPGQPSTLKLPSNLPANLSWLSGTKLVGIRGNRVERWDLTSSPIKSTTLLTVEPTPPETAILHRSPNLELDNSLLAEDPFRDLPRPARGSLNLRGYVDQSDPYEDQVTMMVSLVRHPDGREQFIPRPLPVRLSVPPNAKQIGTDLPLRVLDLAFDQEIEVQVTATKINDRDVYPIRWAFFPTWDEEGYEDLKNFPKLAGELNYIWRQAVDVKVVVPMVFPTTDSRVKFQDWWMAPRGGGTRKHIGQDLMGPKMATAVACFDGVISLGRDRGNAGHTITLKNRSGWTAQYYHMNNDTPGSDDGRGGDTYAFAPGIVNGSRVVAGQLIGWIGDSGNAEGTGPHIHFELWYEPRRVVVNAYASLKAARRLKHPRYPDPAPFLQPAATENRTDGIVTSYDPESRDLRVIRLATLVAGKTPQVALKPEWDRLNIRQSQIRVRRPDATAVGHDEVRAGMPITILTPRKDPQTPRVVALDSR